VLFGQADPGGRLPVSLPRRRQDCPADLSYPGELGELEYCDGVFPGYRGYLRRGISPHFAFGHGLSYSTFHLAPMDVDRETFGPEESVRVTVEVTNSGARSGSQVLQLYVSDLASELLRPERELKAFAKVHLAAGQRTSVTWTLDPRAFAAWHPGHQVWVVEPGVFELHLGTSAVDIAQRRAITCLPTPA
jgi:beta-glucosidase